MMVFADDMPPKVPPAKPPMAMQGKIVKQGKCLHCKGKFIALIPEGETKPRVMHNDPHCKQFRDDPHGYWKLHSMSGAKRKELQRRNRTAKPLSDKSDKAARKRQRQARRKQR